MAVYSRGTNRASNSSTFSSKPRSRRGRWALAAAVSLTTAAVWSDCAEAARGGNDVKGAKVIAGAAQISNKGNTTTIRAIDKTIIKYDRFNIPKKGTVKFVQPSKTSTVLNRIDGAMPSRIDGQFTANGVVFFVNPAGVMFGPTSVIDVGQLYAGAGSISDQDFLGGVNKFSTAKGSVVNHGTIKGEAVHLFGSQVVNRGAIVADGGIVTMSSGKDVFIGEEGGNIMVKVENGAAASRGGAGVTNTGSITAGTVKMMGAGDIYSIAINNKGLIKAKDVTVDAGQGAAIVSGTIDASDKSAGAVGGKVQVLGEQVALVGAKIDVSGTAGGGTALIGGDLQGGGTTPTASHTLVSKTSEIKADAIESGNGGKVIVWADKGTAFFGEISAKGGAASGNGGFVEVSGKENLLYRGEVDVTAPNGTTGTLLLDPGIITITDGVAPPAEDAPDINGAAPGTDDITDVNDLSDPGFFGTETSVISSGNVEALLLDGVTLILAASDTINVNDGIAPAAGDEGSLTLQAPTINLNATITLNGAGVLSGNATNVFVNAGGTIDNGLAVSAAGGTVTVNQATLTVNAPLAVNDGRNLTLQVPTVTLNNTITMNGGGTLSGNAVNVAVNAGGSIQNGVDIAASGATVDVGAGTFSGNVNVNKSISLLGNNDAKNGFDGTRNPESVVQGQVQLTAANTTFAGFTVEGVATGAGVVASNAQGDVIENNIIRDNVFGLSLASDGSTVVSVQGNLFDTNTRAGSASGNGIYTDFTVSNVLVDNNHFTGNTEGSVSFFGSAANPQSNVTISNNVMTNDGPIGLETINDVTITGNDIVNAAAHAIWVAGGVSDVTISNNFLDGNGGAGVKFTENIDATPASDFTITNNSISNNADGGIVINAGRYSGALDATGNWWGSANGPTDAGNTFNVGAQGNAIVNPGGTTVNYVRWLDSGVDANGTTTAFEPAGNLFAPVTLGGLFFSNIQSAITAASAGNTINLAPGAFTEALTNSAPLTLHFTGNGTLENSAGALVLGANLTISANGSLTINENVNVVSHGLTLDTKSLTLPLGTSVTVNGPITSAGGSVTMHAKDNLTLGAGATIDPPNTVTLTSNDDIIVNSAVEANNLITVSAGEDGSGSFTIAAGGSLDAQAAGSDVLITTGTASGNVALGGSVSAVDLVSITTAGTVSQSAGAITAARLGIGGDEAVTLNQSNAVGTLAITTNDAEIQFTNGGALTIGSVGTVDGVDAGTQDVLINSGALTINQPISGGTVRIVSSAGVSQGASGIITANALGVRAGGDVTLTRNNAVGTFAASTAAGSGDVAFVNSGSLTVGTVGASGTFAAASGINAGLEDVLVSAGDINITQQIAASGTVRFVSGAGVTQTAGGIITAGLLGVRANGIVDLNNATNSLGTVAINNTAAGAAVDFDEADAVVIGTVAADGGGIFAATSGITSNGGAITVDAGGAITVSQPVASGGAAVTLDAAGMLTLNANVSGSGITLEGDAVNQSAASTVNGAAGLISVNANGGPVNMLGTLTTANATASAIEIINGSTVALGNISTPGGLDIAGASGNVTQNGSTTINVDDLAVSTGGSVNLGNNNSIGTVNGITSSGGLTINDVSGGLVLSGPINGGAGDDVTITTDGGGLSIETDITGGAVRLAGDGITQTAGNSVTANTLRLDSVGNVVLTDLNNDIGTLAANVTGNLNVNDGSGGLIIGAASGLNGINIGAGDLILATNGSLTQTQPITAGDADFSTGSNGDIDLSNGSNSISGVITFAPDGTGDATLLNNGATNLGASTIGGDLSVTSTGAITDSGTLNVGGSATFITRNNLGANITLDEAASTFGTLTARARDAAGAADADGNISIHENGTMDVVAISSGGGDITLEADKINLGAANTVESSGGNLVLQPTNGAAPINLGTNVPLVFSFSGTDLAALRNGFNSITVGRSGGSGIVTVSGPVSFADDTSIIGGNFIGGSTIATTDGADLNLHATTGTIGTVVVPVDVLVAGTLNVETDGANTNGDIFITSGGPLTVGSNVSTDTATSQTVSISASTLTIDSANPNSANDHFALSASGAVTLNNVTFTGNSILVSAGADITDSANGVLATTGSGGLTLITSGGGIGIDNTNALGVNVGGAGILTIGSVGTPVGGDVFVISPAALSVGQVHTTGAVQTIDIRTTGGNLLLNNSITGNDNFVLSSAGNLNNSGLLTAASVDADAASGIGNLGTFTVSTPMISADSSTSGNVNVDNTSSVAVLIGSLSTAGSGNVNYVQSGGGAATFGPVSTAANGDINLSNSGNDITISGSVSAGGTGDVAIISPTSSANVTVNAPVTGENVTVGASGNVITSAGGTIGAINAVDVTGGLAVTVGGGITGAAIDINSGTDTTVNANVTATGTADIDAGGAIGGTGTVGGAVVDLTAGNGINLNVAGATVNASTSGAGTDITLTTSSPGTVTLNNISAGAGGDITVTQSGAGNNLVLVSVNAAGGHVALTTLGTINEATNDDAAAHVAEIIANTAALTASNGIGTSSVLDLNATNTVNLTSGAGSASIANSGALTLGTSNVNGDLNATADTGNLTVSGVLTAGNVSLTTAEAGRTINVNDDIVVNATTGNVTLTADEINLNDGPGSVIGGGTITLQPLTPTQGINVGFTSGPGLTDSDIAAIAGFDDIVIGRSNGEHAIVVDSASFPASVTLRTPNGGFVRVVDQLDTLASATPASVTINGALQLEDDIVTQGGAVTVNGATTLQGALSPSIDTTNNGAVGASGNITFAGPGTINATDGRGLALHAGSTGSVNIAGDVGNGAGGQLANFTVTSAANTTLGGTLRVVGDINLATNGLAFNGGANSVSSSGDGTLTIAPLTDDVSIDVGSPTGGTGTLDISTADLAALQEGFNLITIGSVTGTGVTTIGNAAFKDAVTFHQPVGAGVIQLNGALSTDAGTTPGSVIFNGPVSVIGNSSIDTDADSGTDGSITFNRTINGGSALTANAGGGSISVAQDIGGSVPVGSIDFTGFDIGLQNVETTGSQTYTPSGLVTLSGATYRSTGGSISFEGNAALANPTTQIQSGGGTGDDIVFQGNVNGASALTLAAGPDGNIEIVGSAGNSTPLTSLTASGVTITLHDVSTAGAQEYTGSQEISLNGNLLNSDGPITLTGPVQLDGPTTIHADATNADDDDNVLITGTINGGHTLAIDVDGDGDLTITGAVGGTAPLTSTDFTSDAITLNGVRTTGTQEYLARAPLTLSGTYQNNSGIMTFEGVGVTLAGNVTITGGGITEDDDITITGEITGANALSVTAGGSGTAADVVINDNVTEIASLAVTANDITVQDVFTSGGQLYTGSGIISLDGTYDSDTGNITFAGNSRLMSNVNVITRAANDVEFTGTVTGNVAGHDLTINAGTTGNVTIGGNAGGGTGRLGAVTITALDMNLRDINSEDAQVYNITGVGTLQGTYNASTTNGSITFDGGSLLLNGATTISTSGGAEANDIEINSDINSSSANNNLTLTASGSGDIDVNGNIGGTLATTAIGVLDVDGDNVGLRSVRSTGNQSVKTNTLATGVITLEGDYSSSGGLFDFNGNVTLGENVTVTASGGENTDSITFTGTIDGNRSLLLTTTSSGDIFLQGAAGGTTPANALTSFTANGDSVQLRDVNTSGDISITARTGGTISPRGTYGSATGAITFTGNTALAAAVTVNAAGGDEADDVKFTGTITGAQTLVVTAATDGDVTFEGAVGGVASTISNPSALTSLVVSGNVITLHNVNTNTGQTYTAGATGASIVARDTYQNNSTGAIRFNGPVRSHADATGLNVTNRGGDNSADITFSSTINMAGTTSGSTRPLTLNTGISDGGGITVGDDISGASTFNAAAGRGDLSVRGVATSSTQLMTGRDINVGGDLTATTVTATATRDMELNNVTTSGVASPASTVDQNFNGRNITLNSEYVTNGPGSIRFRGDVQLANDVFVSTIGGRNSDIVMVGRITGNRELNLNTLSNTNRTAATVELGDTRATVTGNNVDIGNLIINEDLVFDRTPINGTVVIAGRDANGAISNVPGFTYRIRTSGEFEMQRQDKLVVLGNLELDADVATISDITTTGDMLLNANEIVILRRAPGKVVQFSNGRPNGDLQDDLGVDYVAGGRIAFNGTVRLDGAGADPRFATTSGERIEGLDGQGFLNQLFDTDINFDLLFNSGPLNVGDGSDAVALLGQEVFDLRAQGASPTNPAATLAGAAPQESRQPEIESAVASSQAKALEEMGIFTKDLQIGELIAFLEGIVLYDDVPNSLATGAQPRPEDFKVTKDRLSAENVRRVLDLYYSIYYETDESGRLVMKDGKPVENTPAMKKAIEAAVTAYRAKTGQRTGSIDPQAFREYVETNPSQVEALKHMNRLRELFDEILPTTDSGSRKGLGITPREAARSRSVLVENLGVSNMTIPELEQAIRHKTGRAVATPAAKPAAKPAVNPAAKPAANGAKPANAAPVNNQAKPAGTPNAAPANQPKPNGTPTAAPTPRPNGTPTVTPQPRPAGTPTGTPTPPTRRPVVLPTEPVPTDSK